MFHTILFHLSIIAYSDQKLLQYTDNTIPSAVIMHTNLIVTFHRKLLEIDRIHLVAYLLNSFF